jgi:type II secretory pathway component PulC
MERLIMNEQIKEIKQAIREIERNLVLLSGEGRDLTIALTQAHEAIEEFDEYSLPNIVEAIK